MLEKLKNWFRARHPETDSPSDLKMTGSHAAPPQVRPKPKVPRPSPEFVDADKNLTDDSDNDGQGKNVLIRNKFVREDTGTHETLKILDDSMVDSGEEPGLDPYNTGGFDRSKNWDRRFGK